MLSSPYYQFSYKGRTFEIRESRTAFSLRLEVFEDGTSFVVPVVSASFEMISDFAAVSLGDAVQALVEVVKNSVRMAVDHGDQASERISDSPSPSERP